MLIADKQSIESFKNSVRKKKADKVAIIIDNYLKKNSEFHKFFLQSGFSMGLEVSEIKKIIDNLKSNEIKESILLDLKSILHIREIIELYKIKNIETIKNYKGKLYIDDLFNSMEIIKFIMKKEQKTYDNTKQEVHILRSQYNNLLDSFPVLIELIQNEKLKSKTRKTSKFHNVSIKIIDKISRHSILKNFLLEIFSEHLSPTIEDISKYNIEDKEKLNEILKHENIFLLSNKQKYWKCMEIYRDLSYRHLLENVLPVTDTLKLMKENKVLKKDTRNLMHFDLNNHSQYYLKKELAENSQVLQFIYDLNVDFKYENSQYKLKDLINILEKLVVFSKNITDDNYSTNTSNDIFIKKFDKKNLCRILNIPPNNIKLLDLITYDLKDIKNKAYEVNFKYLIKNDNVYFILPFWIEHIEVANFIDKIISSEKIKVLVKEKKGYKFEHSIREIFKKYKIPFHITKRNNNANIPEIDGMFELGNYLFLIEAKATVKSSSYMEMYNTLNSTIEKAHSQLLLRVDQLNNDSKFKIKLSKDFGINLKEKKVVPLILLTNPLFNGYKELKIENALYDHIPIIDFLTLKHIISSHTTLSWKFNSIGKYESTELQLKDFENGESLVEYLHNPIHLDSIRKPLVQLLDEGVMYYINTH